MHNNSFTSCDAVKCSQPVQSLNPVAMHTGFQPILSMVCHTMLTHMHKQHSVHSCLQTHICLLAHMMSRAHTALSLSAVHMHTFCVIPLVQIFVQVYWCLSCCKAIGVAIHYCAWLCKKGARVQLFRVSLSLHEYFMQWQLCLDTWQYMTTVVLSMPFVTIWHGSGTDVMLTLASQTIMLPSLELVWMKPSPPHLTQVTGLV